jgi:hypothetical protein
VAAALANQGVGESGRGAGHGAEGGKQVLASENEDEEVGRGERLVGKGAEELN